MLNCSPEQSLNNIKGIDLSGYEVIKVINFTRGTMLQKSGNCSTDATAQYSLCNNDMPSLTDARFDATGKVNYATCRLLSENANFALYKDFLRLFGVSYMADHLKNGNGKSLDLSNDNKIVNSIQNSTLYNEFVTKFSNIIKQYIVGNTLTSLNNESFNAINPPDFSIKRLIFVPTAAYAAIGGTQKYEADIILYRKKVLNVVVNNPANYKVEYRFNFLDTYGADFDDMNVGVKGAIYALNSFFTLQHYHSGYKPYITNVRINSNVLNLN
ncbi:hypothetical protein FQZ97_838970 [compost metagenome]